jgi:hypothetical protein
MDTLAKRMDWKYCYISTTSFLFLVVTFFWLLKILHRSSIGLDIRPQSAFTAFRALLLSANYSAERSGQVWQPAADSNVRLSLYFYI